MKKGASSIPQFCREHNFSRATYYNLRSEDRPNEMRIRGRVLISDEAAAEWRQRMTTRTRRLATA